MAHPPARIIAPEHGQFPHLRQENLPQIREEAGLTERRELLIATLDAVYVDTAEVKSVVAIRTTPVFRPIIEVATTRAGSVLGL